MDRSGEDKLEAEKRKGDAVNYHSPNSMPSDWQYGCGGNFMNSSMGLRPNVNSGTMVHREDHLGGPSCSSASLVDSFGQTIWDHPHNPQSLGFDENNVHAGLSIYNPVLDLTKGVPVCLRGSGVGSGWDAVPSTMLKGGHFLSNVPGMILPHSLAQFPADSAFIERAARFSSLNAGHLGDMVNPFGIDHSANSYLQGGPILQGPPADFSGNSVKALSCGGHLERTEVNLAETSKDMILAAALMDAAEDSLAKVEREDERSQDEGKPLVETSLDESDQAQSSGCGAVGQADHSGGDPSFSKGLGSKKRKRGCQGNVAEQNTVQEQSGEATKDNTKIQHKGGQNPNSTNDKSTGKHGKKGSQSADQPTEEYIHVRARRGQATNSHSLAERVRREKISERMKFLQDLVPGCSKVTGKAVMLDEIINYVQSLQRQVEFLSMKLATVNPRLDFNIESLLAKDQPLFSTRAGPSLGFTPDLPIAYPPLHPSQPPIIQQSGLPGIGKSSDAQRTITSQPTTVGEVYKEPTQLSNAWEAELHNVIQMGFNSGAPLNSEDING